MPEVVVRKVKIEDAVRLAELTRQLTKNIVAGLERRTEKFITKNNTQWFMAVKDGLVVGSAGLVWYEIPSKSLMGWIEEVIVDENYRRQGIADLFIDRILEFGEDLGLTQIKLTTANGGARFLYERHGFADKQEILMVKKYY